MMYWPQFVDIYGTRICKNAVQPTLIAMSDTDRECLNILHSDWILKESRKHRGPSGCNVSYVKSPWSADITKEKRKKTAKG